MKIFKNLALVKKLRSNFQIKVVENMGEGANDRSVPQSKSLTGPGHPAVSKKPNTSIGGISTVEFHGWNKDSTVLSRSFDRN